MFPRKPWSPFWLSAVTLLFFLGCLGKGVEAGRPSSLAKVEEGVTLSGPGAGFDFMRNLRVKPEDGNGTALDRYMAIPTPEYTWNYTGAKYEGHIPFIGGYTAYTLNMTSQKWLTEEEVGRCKIWEHAVVVVVPHNYDPNIKTAVIWPTEGNDPPTVPSESDWNQRLVTVVAVTTRAITVSLYEVPNQYCNFPDDPTHENRTEDSLIAFTWRKYLDVRTAGDPDGRAYLWPAFNPMTKATVRAMDATEEFLSQCDECGMKDHVPEGWIPFGASKRGWVAWLLAAVDKRVTAIAPVVMDCLHMHRTMHRWYQNYGGWTFIVLDYFNEEIFSFLDSKAMEDFLAFMDPIVYKDRYETLTKLVISSTGDEFFQVIDDHYWFDEMPGKTLLLKAPNADHFEITGIPIIIPTLATFVHILNYESAGLDSKALGLRVQQESDIKPKLPDLTWKMWYEGEGANQVAYINATINLSGGAPKPKAAYLMHSHTDPNHKRLDFRWFNLDEECALPRMMFYGSSVCPIQLVWLDDLMDPAESTAEALTYTASMAAPADGSFGGFYIQFEFPGPSTLLFDYSLATNTQVAIVPNGTLPFEDCSGTGCQGKLV